MHMHIITMPIIIHMHRYPALTKDSKCTIDTAAFPKTIDCTYNLVLAENFALTFQVRLDDGWCCLKRGTWVVPSDVF